MIILALLCGIVSLFHNSAFYSSRPELPTVVEGYVWKNVNKGMYSSTATILITKVYCGRRELVGSFFQDRYAFFESTGESAGTVFTFGEKGLWTVQKEKGLVRTVHDGRIPFYTRTRQNAEHENKRYLQFLTLAQELSLFHDYQGKDRADYAKSKMHSDVPEVSVWFTRYYLFLAKEEAVKYLSSLSIAQLLALPLQTQFAIDTSLCEKLNVEWIDAEKRKNWMRKWLENIDDMKASLLLSHFDSIDQNRYIESDQFLTYLQKIYYKKGISEDVQCRCISLITRSAKWAKSSEKYFQFVVDELKNNRSVEIQRWTSGCLIELCESDSKRKEIVRTVAKEIKDPIAVEKLKKATDKSNVRK